MHHPKLEGITRHLLFEHMYSKYVNCHIFSKNHSNKKSVFLRFLFTNRRSLTLLYRYLDSMCLTFQEENCRFQLNRLSGFNFALYLEFPAALTVLNLTSARGIRLELDKNFELAHLGHFVDYMKDVKHLQIYKYHASVARLFRQQQNLKSLHTELSLFYFDGLPKLKLDDLYLECRDNRGRKSSLTGICVNLWERYGRVSYNFSPLLHHEIKHLDLTNFRNRFFNYEFFESPGIKNNTVKRLSLNLADVHFVRHVFPLINSFREHFEALKELDIRVEMLEKTSKGARYAHQLIEFFDDLQEFSRKCFGILNKISVNLDDYTYLKKESDLQRFLKVIQQSEQLQQARFESDPKQLSKTLMLFEHTADHFQLDLKIGVVFIEGNPNYEDEFTNWEGMHSTDESDVDMR